MKKMTKKTKKTLKTVAIGAGVLTLAYVLYQKSGLWRENLTGDAMRKVGAYSLNKVGAYTMRRSNMGVYTSKSMY